MISVVTYVDPVAEFSNNSSSFDNICERSSRYARETWTMVRTAGRGMALGAKAVGMMALLGAGVSAMATMNEDLDRERRSMEHSWSKREKQLQQVLVNIAGMHGDLAGFAGASLPGIKTLELPLDVAHE